MSDNYWSITLNHRMRRRRAIAALGGLAASAAILAACGEGSDGGVGGDSSGLVSPEEDTTKQAKRGGTLKYYQTAEIPNFDMAIANAPLNRMQLFVYETLLASKPGVLKPPEYDVVPSLAESWEWSPDLLQLTLKLRKGVKWHNKAPVNGRLFEVQDVVASWDRFVARATNRSELANAVSASAPVLSLSSVDASTVVIKLKQPSVYLLNQLAWFASGGVNIFPKETDGAFDIRRDMIGTGPFFMSEYQPSVGLTLKRNVDYWDPDLPYIDQVDNPVILEYAQGLAQLKAGNLYTWGVRAEDVLTTKRDVMDLKLYKTRAYSLNLGKTGFGYKPGSPFLDERVRQAYSMSLDRDLWIDTFNNASRFRSEGLPVETFWNTNLNNGVEPWWLDPQGKDFGPNAKYFQHDVAEAKRLLSAAGFANGIDTVYTVIQGTQLGQDLPQRVDVETGMVSEAGIRVSRNLVDYASEYIPQYRDAKGRFDGLCYVAGSPSGQDPVIIGMWEHHSKIGSLFFGFDAAGRGDGSGDPQVDSLLEKAAAEPDVNRRRALVHDLQRYIGKTRYISHIPGGASSFSLAWPAIGNFNTFQVTSGGLDIPRGWWIDQSQAPIKKA